MDPRRAHSVFRRDQGLVACVVRQPVSGAQHGLLRLALSS